MQHGVDNESCGQSLKLIKNAILGWHTMETGFQVVQGIAEQHPCPAAPICSSMPAGGSLLTLYLEDGLDDWRIGGMGNVEIYMLFILGSRPGERENERPRRLAARGVWCSADQQTTRAQTLLRSNHNNHPFVSQVATTVPLLQRFSCVGQISLC